MTGADPIDQAAEAAEVAFTAMLAAANAKPCSTLIVPPNAPEGEELTVFGLPIPPGATFPPNDVAISRLQQILDEGMAVYLVSTDRALLGRFARLVRALAQTVAPPASVS